MLQIAIVDDEEAARALLQQETQAALTDVGMNAEIRQFSDADSFLQVLPSTSFQLVFLDIQMKGINGMACAEEIRAQDQQMLIIFVTSMVQYAVQGYKVNALDYIVKPFTGAQLRLCLSRALERFKNLQPRMISFRTPGGITTVSISDILYVEAVNHSAVARTARGDIPCGMTLSAVESKLQPYGFFRCHAGFLINLSAVEQVTAADAAVTGRLVPVSKHRRHDLMQAITAWWGKNL